MKAKRVAILGCGYWGQNLVRNFNALGALEVVIDPAASGRATAQRLVPGLAVHAEIERALENPAVDGVVVATPAETHAELCLLALRAGKDVFCEKPLALRYDDALEVTSMAEQTGRVLMVGHILEYHPAIIKLRKLIDEGALGNVQYIYSNRLNLGKNRREGNILWSFAPHDIAIILRLFRDLPHQVIAAGGAYVQPNIADVAVSQMLYEDGRAAHVFVSWLNPFKEQKLVVVGSKRMATFDDVRKELVLHDQRVDMHDGEPVPVKGEGKFIEYATDEPLALECRAFLDAMTTRHPPLTDAESALRVLKVLQALQRSLLAHGQPVTLPNG